jgi:hypothetical protein
MAGDALAKEYDKLAQKYGLPAYAQLEPEFDLGAIPKGAPYVLKEVSKRLFERLDTFRKTLETLIHPELVLDMLEAESLTDLERASAAELLRTLMALDRSLLIAELDNTNDAYARWIADAAQKWHVMKATLRALLERIEMSWKSSRKIKEKLHYLG